MLNLTVIDFFFPPLSFCVTGINDQGLYRVVGVSSKVQRLLSLLMGMPLFYNFSIFYFLLFYCQYLGLESTCL